MALTYEKNAKREQVWLRAFLMGPSGSGKSLGALKLATSIFGGKLHVTLINSEQRDSGKPYADRFDFDFIDLAEGGDFSPETYIKALDLAEAENPGGVYVLDSASHEWMGAGGILSLADRFGDWKVVRPRHNAFAERLMSLNGHLIITVRAKMKYEVGEEEVGGRKRQVIRMLGVGPIQSDDLQYEFNLTGRFEQGSHDVSWSGHIDPLTDTVSNFADEEQTAAVAAAATKWLTEGNPLPELPKAADEAQIAALVESLKAEGIADDVIERGFAKARREHRGVLSADYVKATLDGSKKRLAEKNAAAKATESSDKPGEAPGDEAAETKSAEPTPEELALAGVGDMSGSGGVDEAEVERLWAESQERTGAPDRVG